MHPLIVTISLPAAIKKQLQSICYGLPNTQWTDPENFHLILYQIDPLPPLILKDLQEAFSHFTFPAFDLSLKRIVVSQAAKKKGTLSIELSSSDTLLVLQKEIQSILMRLKLLSSSTKHQHFLIPLGYFDNLSDQRLADYLGYYSLFQTASFTVNTVDLLLIKETYRKTLYELLNSSQAPDKTIRF